MKSDTNHRWTPLSKALMKIILISRHATGTIIPESVAAQNLQDMGALVSLLNASVAMPIRGQFEYDVFAKISIENAARTN